MVPAENRGPGLGTAGDVCGWLAPVCGPVLRSGARGQVQPAHRRPHPGTGPYTWRNYLVVPRWRGQSLGVARDVCAYAFAPASRLSQCSRLAVPTRIRSAPWPSVPGADAPRAQVRATISDRSGGGALRPADTGENRWFFTNEDGREDETIKLMI